MTLLLVLLGATAVASSLMGVAKLQPSELLHSQIFLQLRLPRILLCILAGAGLSDSRIGAFTWLLQTCEVLSVTIGKPELTDHEAVGIFGLGEVGIHFLGVKVQGIHVIHWEGAVYAGGLFAHGVIYARGASPNTPITNHQLPITNLIS